MKQASLLFTFFIAFCAQAQVYQYVPFPDSVGLWKYKTLDQSGIYWSADEFYADAVGAKKVMVIQNIYNYNQIANDTLKYFEKNKQIIRLVFDTLEFVLFDFNLSVGDTFYDSLSGVYNGIYERGIIVQDDSTSAWYGNRRVLEFDNGAKWLEGVGNIESCKGVFDPLFTSGLGCRLFECVFSDSVSFPCVDAFVLSDGVETDQKNHIQVFPNPTMGLLTIESPNDLIRIELRDVTGKLLLLKETNLHLLDISHLPNGLYMVSLHSTAEMHLQKIVKH